MKLSDSQKSAVSQWIQAGDSLAQVQRHLSEEFSLSMTYMDVRFLVDDLDISMADPEAEVNAQDAGEADGSSAADTDIDTVAIEPEIVDEVGNRNVSVDVDALMRPGALVSGTVQFSDGVSLAWQLGASGQLGLIPGDDPEYRPSPEDVEAFQAQLEEVLKKKGF